MFGSPITNYFDFLLGITDGSECGYQSLVIKPFLPSKLSFIEGERRIPSGKVFVRVERENGGISARVVLSTPVPAIFAFGDKRITLHEGENEIFIETT